MFLEMGLVKRSDLYLMIVILMFVIGLSNGYKFYVGGKNGWILTPSEDYSHWSHRNRFQVNDTLYFKYVKGKDSVLVVNTEEEYKKCNTTHPITSLSDGDSIFKLTHSGTFFFISGKSQNCFKGQKLAVTVMSTVHHSHSPHHPSISPATSPSSSPTVSPSSAPVELPSPTGHQMPSPVPSPRVDSFDSDAITPAPAPASASNSAGLVVRGMSSLGLVLVVMIMRYMV